MADERTRDGFDFEVIVIGGGAAGLSGAVTLARSRRSVAVIDAGEPRNAPAGHVHNYLGREGTPPADLLAIGRQELSGYGGTMITGRATSAAREQDGAGFTVRLDDGRVLRARRLLIASGLVDELPELPGVAELWGSGVLHCPYCHGWEVRDSAVGVLASGPMSVHQALLFRQLTDDVVLFRHTALLDDDQLERLAARGITVVDGAVAALEHVDGRLTGVRLASGELHPRAAVVVATRMEARAGFLASLGLQPEPMEMNGTRFGSRIVTDANGATAVPGVWAAGNVTDLRAQVISSSSAGVNAGAMINADLVEAETAAAVEARREQDRQPIG